MFTLLFMYRRTPLAFTMNWSSLLCPILLCPVPKLSTMCSRSFPVAVRQDLESTAWQCRLRQSTHSGINWKLFSVPAIVLLLAL